MDLLGAIGGAAGLLAAVAAVVAVLLSRKANRIAAEANTISRDALNYQLREAERAKRAKIELVKRGRGDGIWVAGVRNHRTAFIMGVLRNDSAAPARDTKLRAYYGDSELPRHGAYSVPEYLERDPYSDHKFAFDLPLESPGRDPEGGVVAAFPAEKVIRLGLTYNDDAGTGHVWERCFRFDGDIPQSSQYGEVSPEREWHSVEVDCSTGVQ